MSADLLDRVRPSAGELLSMVDTMLVVHGAPAEHPVWAAARRVGATPQAAVEHFDDLDATRLRLASTRLRGNAREVTGVLASVPEAGWTGAGADAYVARRHALDGFVDDIDNRLIATADHVDTIADWIDGSRDAIARDLAECLGSQDAVLIRSPEESQAASAAAGIAARVLTVVADCIDAGWRVHADWQGRLDVGAGQRPDTAAAVSLNHIQIR
jgi:hypothetical protein